VHSRCQQYPPWISLTQCKAIMLHTICHTSSADVHHYDAHTESTETHYYHTCSHSYLCEIPSSSLCIDEAPSGDVPIVTSASPVKYKPTNNLFSAVTFRCIHTLLSRSALPRQAVHTYIQPVTDISAAPHQNSNISDKHI